MGATHDQITTAETAMGFKIDKLRVRAGTKVDLKDWDADETIQWDGDRPQAEARTAELNAQLDALQELLYAQGKHRVLLVLQAMDAAGKDSTIRHVFEGVNPSGVKVAPFKAPTEQELAHDFLWRVHPHVPANGELTIFNRSHYEDVLAVRVFDLAPKKVWEKRYGHIRNFEQLLVDEGTTIIKIYLHVTPNEQAGHLQERLDDPSKWWKFNPSDIDARLRWPDYMAAFEDAISETSTDDAPWFIVPANRRWYRNLAISEIMVQTLEGLNMDYPESELDLSDQTIPYVAWGD